MPFGGTWLGGRKSRIVSAAAVLVAVAGLATIGPSPRGAVADASAPPPFPANCPKGDNPPTGYPVNAPFHPYEVPFKGIIFNGTITLPPLVEIPHLFASVCGVVQLPQLIGSIEPDNINLATPNIYVGNVATQKFIEAIPASVQFQKLVATLLTTPAHNGGLDTTLQGNTMASVATLGMKCGITLNATFSTLDGQPVTGPTQGGQAVIVADHFPVPATPTTASCPAPIATTFNKLLGLPVPAGVGKFVAPFCFDFELTGPNDPRHAPKPNKDCPWPS